MKTIWGLHNSFSFFLQGMPVLSALGGATPPPKKKAWAVLWNSSCSQECASSLLACEHFSQHHIWYCRECSGGKEEATDRAVAYYVNGD